MIAFLLLIIWIYFNNNIYSMRAYVYIIYK